MDPYSQPGISDSAEWADLTFSMQELLDLAWRWLPPLAIVSFLPYLLVWGLPDAPEWPGLRTAIFGLVLWSVAGIVIYALSALLHEALHLLAMVVVARVPLSSLEFGMRLSEGVLYVHSSRPMSALAYRVVLITPAVALGIVPIVIGTFTQKAWLVAYGFIMLLSAIGDLAVLQLIRHVEAHTPVRDHPNDIGCKVRIRSDPS